MVYTYKMTKHLAIASRTCVLSAFRWCSWARYQLWTTPITYSGIEVSSYSNGKSATNTITKTRKFSEVSHSGIAPLIVPVLISLMALWAILRGKTVGLFVATVLLSIFWLLAGFSIGMAYTPAVVLLVTGVVLKLIPE